MRYARDVAYEQVRALYGGAAPREPAPAERNPLRFMDVDQIERAASSLLGTSLQEVRPLTDGQHSVLSARVDGARMHVKAFRDRASLMAGLLPESPFPSQRPASMAFHRTLYNRENPVTPEMVAWGAETGVPLVVSRWLDADPLPMGPESDQAVARVAEQCREFRPLQDAAVLAEYNARLDALEAGEPDALTAFDEFAVTLNEPMTGSFRAFLRIHPQVELLRIRRMVEEGVWRLPRPLAARMQAVATMLLQRPLNRSTPRMSQGDPKPEHYLRTDGVVRVCDFEHSLYAVGPLDEAFWIATVCFTRRQCDSSRTAIRRLRAMCASDESRHLACCWLFSEIVYRSMVAWVDGDGEALERARSFLADFATEWLLP
jgi:hypothetical protein